jgi:hypothetical protein
MGGPVGCMGSCSLGAERVQALARAEGSSHSTLAGMKGGNQRIPSRPGPRTPTQQSKATLLYTSKPSSLQASKQTNKQTNNPSTFFRAEGASKRLQRCWPACRLPGCSMQRGPKDPVAALRGAQVDPDWRSAASASRRFRLHVLALALAPHGYIG